MPSLIDSRCMAQQGWTISRRLINQAADEAIKCKLEDDNVALLEILMQKLVHMTSSRKNKAVDQYRIGETNKAGEFRPTSS